MTLLPSRSVFESFQRLSLPYLHLKPETDLEWLAIAQHHGLPTRLLDWTTNALAALWFAVREEPIGGRNGAVWILNPTDEDFLEPALERNPFEMRQVKVYRPRHITTRLIAQSGYFTIHPLAQETCRFKPLTEDADCARELIEIQIPPSSFSDIRDNLERHGISDLAMFPDLEGVCRYIWWNNCLMDDESDPPKMRLNRNE